MNKEEAFILDTSILMYVAYYNLPNKEDNSNWRYRTANYFYEQKADNIYILDIAWVEFLGAFLQKRIDFSNYELWYRKRASIIENLFSQFIRNKINYIRQSDQQEYSKVFSLAREIASYSHAGGIAKEVNHRRIEGLKEGLAKAKYVGNKSWQQSMEQKIEQKKEMDKVFDGMDSALVAYSNLFSKLNPDKDIIFVTADVNIKNAIEYCNEINFGRYLSEDWNIDVSGLREFKN